MVLTPVDPSKVSTTFKVEQNESFIAKIEKLIKQNAKENAFSDILILLGTGDISDPQKIFEYLLEVFECVHVDSQNMFTLLTRLPALLNHSPSLFEEQRKLALKLAILFSNTPEAFASMSYFARTLKIAISLNNPELIKESFHYSSSLFFKVAQEYIRNNFKDRLERAWGLGDQELLRVIESIEYYKLFCVSNSDTFFIEYLYNLARDILNKSNSFREQSWKKYGENSSNLNLFLSIVII